MATIKHIAGEFREGKQECIMCGEMICDYTNAHWPAGQNAPKGWAIGPIYISGVNPKIFTTTAPDTGEVSDCTKQ